LESILDIALAPINKPLTFLLIFLTAYRLLTLLLGLDFDFDLDFDLDVDIDSDFDVENSFDSSSLDIEDISNLELKDKKIIGSSQRKLKWWQIILIYFNFSELPFLFTFTAWIFFWWIITIIGTYLTNSYDNTLGLIIFISAILPSLFINKIFTTPFKSFFKKLERKGVKALDLIGRTGTLLSNIENDKLGSVKLFIESDPINIYAQSLDGASITAGEEILIIKESEDKKFYYIKSYT